MIVEIRLCTFTNLTNWNVEIFHGNLCEIDFRKTHQQHRSRHNTFGTNKKISPDQTSKHGKDETLAEFRKSGIHSENSVLNIPIECIHCDSSFSSLEDLRGHVTVHINPALLNTDKSHETVKNTATEFSCSDYGEKFSNLDEFGFHCQKHGSKFSCFVCKKSFKLLYELRVHVKWHFDVISHTCQHCLAKFSTSVMYDKHLSEHENWIKVQMQWMC